MIPWEEYRYTLYAREFGWPPQVVDEIRLDIEPWLIPIHFAIIEAENDELEKARKAAEEKRR